MEFLKSEGAIYGLNFMNHNKTNTWFFKPIDLNHDNIKEFEKKFYTTVMQLLFKLFYQIVNNKEFSEHY